MTVAPEELSTTAAKNLYDLMDGAYLCNDGADEYIQLDIPELDSVEEGYIIAYVPTLENGENAKWTVENGAHTMYFAHPEFTARTPAADVEAWVGECVQKVIAG